MKNIKVSVLALSLLVVPAVRADEVTPPAANTAPAGQEVPVAPKVVTTTSVPETPSTPVAPSAQPAAPATTAAATTPATSTAAVTPVTNTTTTTTVDLTPAKPAAAPAATTPVQVTGDAAKPGILSRLVGNVKGSVSSICATTKSAATSISTWATNNPKTALFGAAVTTAAVVLIAKNYKQLKKMVIKNPWTSAAIAAGLFGTTYCAYSNGVWPFTAAAATPAAKTPATTPAPATEVTTPVVPVAANAAPAAVIPTPSK